MIVNRGALAGFAMVVATLLVTVALTYLNSRRMREFDRIVDRSHEVLQELKALLAAVASVEAGHHGYVVTGEAEYRQAYAAALLQTEEQLQRVRRLIADNREQQARLARLEQALNNGLTQMDDNVQVREERGFEAARTFVQAGGAKEAIDSARLTLRQMERHEEQLLAARDHDAESSYRTAIISGLLTALMGVVLATGGYLLVERYLARRARAAAELQEANERLEDRVRERTATISTANQALRDEIDERRHAEEQAMHFAQELQRSNRELEQFAAVASHDLQEPLRKIQAFGDRLQSHGREELDKKGREYLDRILASAARMRKLIDDLLAYARVSTAAQSFTAVDLERVAREVVGDLDARLHQTDGAVHIGELPTIAADAVQMRQLLQNLIGNALKFHRPGVPPVVRVEGRVAPQNGAAADAAARCELIVEDNGIGFEPVYAARIFDLFQRLHGRDAFEGTGMGLAICRKIVERHGGTIAAESSPGQGARFVITLPVEQEEAGGAGGSTT